MLTEGFKRDMKAGVQSTRAFQYDSVILDELRALRDRLCGEAPQIPFEGRPWFPSPLLVRAMILIEGGGPAGPQSGRMHDDFPMQVGYRKADEGLPALQAGNGNDKANQGAGVIPTLGARKILLASTGKDGRAAIQGAANVRLGITYILVLQVTKMGFYSERLEGPSKQVTVGKGGSLDQIAADHGSRADVIFAANPELKSPAAIKPGQLLVVPPARLAPKPVFGKAPKDADVLEWLANHYNYGDREHYAEKLRFVMDLFRARAAALGGAKAAAPAMLPWMAGPGGALGPASSSVPPWQSLIRGALAPPSATPNACMVPGNGLAPPSTAPTHVVDGLVLRSTRNACDCDTCADFF
ncbi:MAG: LysM peptidoglycan-binding domain-containing protein [Acetobacteraceae bacterium]|nr:LysM peptidoglycan-binding domain-containing protein [Acetobacteraceae bacterium]